MCDQGRFLGENLADHFGVCDFFAVVYRDVIVVDDIEGVGALDTLG